jgi:hypothetical protein
MWATGSNARRSTVRVVSALPAFSLVASSATRLARSLVRVDSIGANPPSKDERTPPSFGERRSVAPETSRHSFRWANDSAPSSGARPPSNNPAVQFDVSWRHFVVARCRSTGARVVLYPIVLGTSKVGRDVGVTANPEHDIAGGAPARPPGAASMSIRHSARDNGRWEPLPFDPKTLSRDGIVTGMRSTSVRSCSTCSRLGLAWLARRCQSESRHIRSRKLLRPDLAS